jgi:hypothetical protein
MAKLVSKMCLLLVVVSLFSSFSLSSYNGDFAAVDHTLLLSVAPPTGGIDSILVVIVVLAVLVGAAVAIALRRRVKVVVAAVTVFIVVVAGFGAVWYSQASINYWLVSPYTTWTEDNPLTVNCQNTGHLPGTFDLLLAFTNAHFSLKTSLPYNLVDNQTVKFTFTLQPGETQSREAWFIIDNNVSDFYISLAFQQNDGNFLVKSGPGGVDSVSYQKDVADVNFTMRTVSPPP